MRHVAPALALIGVLLSAAACGTAGSPGPDGSAGPAPAPGSTSADGAQAQTRALCETLGQVYSRHLGPFAEALSATVEGGTAEREAAAQKQVREQLDSLATAVTEATRANPDEQVQADGEKTAASLRKTSADETFFRGVRSTEDVNTVIGTTMKTWMEPVARHCS